MGGDQEVVVANHLPVPLKAGAQPPLDLVRRRFERPDVDQAEEVLHPLRQPRRPAALRSVSQLRGDNDAGADLLCSDEGQTLRHAAGRIVNDGRQGVGIEQVHRQRRKGRGADLDAGGRRSCSPSGASVAQISSKLFSSPPRRAGSMINRSPSRRTTAASGAVTSAGR